MENQIGTVMYSIKRNYLSSEYHRNWVEEILKMDRTNGPTREAVFKPTDFPIC